MDFVGVKYRRGEMTDEIEINLRIFLYLFILFLTPALFLMC